jgi:hypothetical protein
VGLGPLPGVQAILRHQARMALVFDSVLEHLARHRMVFGA